MKKVVLLVLAYIFIGDSLAQSRGKIDSLRLVLSKYATKNNLSGADTTLVNIYCELGAEYTKLKSDSAVGYLQKALSISNKENYKTGLVQTYSQFGRYYFMQFLPAKAIEYWFKALVIAEQLNDLDNVRFINGRVGMCYFIMEDYTRALTYFEKYSAMCKTSRNTEDYLLSINNIGILYFSKKDYTNALHYFNMCDSLNRSVMNPKAQTSALINIAKTQVELKNYANALQKFKTALEIEDTFDDRIAFVGNEIAKVYLLQQNNKEALKYATLALNHIEKTNMEMNGELAKTLSDIYEKTGNIGLAYKYYKDYTRIRLNQDSTKNSQLLRLVQVDYENEKSNEQITKLNSNLKEKQANARIMYISLFCLLVVVVIIAAYIRALASKNKLIETQKADIQKLNELLEYKVEKRTEELTIANKKLKRKNDEIREALLQGQTMERERVASELHDNIGGTLSALKWRFEALDRGSLSEKEQKIYDGILMNMHRAYSEIRLISHNMLPAEFEEKGLIGALENFLTELDTTTSKIKFGLDTSQLHRGIRPEVAIELYICCFETVNNIIKHAVATEVAVSIEEKENGELEILIEDNGKGFELASSNNGKGLKNVAARVGRINGVLSISSQKNIGTIVMIRVPALHWEDRTHL